MYIEAALQVPLAENADDVIQLAKAKVSKRLVALDMDREDFYSADFYWRFRHALSSITFTKVSESVVRATTPDPQFQYVCGEILDVDTVLRIFNDGHMCESGDRSYLFTLSAGTCTNCA